MRAARELHVTGSVQGVGFRWTAKRIADALGVCGWIRNNPDGSVALRIEGEEELLNQLVERLDQAMGRHIVGLTSNDVAPNNRHQGFEIAH